MPYKDPERKRQADARRRARIRAALDAVDKAADLPDRPRWDTCRCRDPAVLLWVDGAWRCPLCDRSLGRDLLPPRGSPVLVALAGRVLVTARML